MLAAHFSLLHFHVAHSIDSIQNRLQYTDLCNATASSLAHVSACEQEHHRKNKVIRKKQPYEWCLFNKVSSAYHKLSPPPTHLPLHGSRPPLSSSAYKESGAHPHFPRLFSFLPLSLLSSISLLVCSYPLFRSVSSSSTYPFLPPPFSHL